MTPARILAQSPPFEVSEPVDLRVFLAPGVEASIEAHAASEPHHEICGALFGHRGCDAAGPFVIVSRAVVGRFADQQGASVKFTHQTWDYIYSELSTMQDGSVIVGWYHSHPGFGVFYSAYDSFIQKHFFGEPWQVGIVIDPSDSSRGVFANTSTGIIGQLAYWNMAINADEASSPRICVYRDRFATNNAESKLLDEALAAGGDVSDILSSLRSISDSIAAMRREHRTSITLGWSAIGIALATLICAAAILVRIAFPTAYSPREQTTTPPRTNSASPVPGSQQTPTGGASNER